MSGPRLSFLDYSVVEPYLDENGQQCIFAYDPGTPYWQKFTYKDVHIGSKAKDNGDVKAWCYIFGDADFWHLPGDLNFPAGIPTPEDLQEIYRCLVIYINSHVWIPDDRAPFVLANWIILSYFRDSFKFIPLVIMDGVTNSGKSTLGEVLMAACYRGSTLANFTPAVTVRMVNKYHTSMFLDEFLDALGRKDNGNILNIIKSMSAIMPYARSRPYSSTEIDHYRIKTSAAISIKGQEIPEDIVNRGIRIQMLTKPNNVKLENLDIDEDEPIDGSYSLREIRAKLTALKISMEIHDDIALINTHNYTDWPNLISEKIKEAHRMLITKAENGEWLYGISYGLKNAPMITNRLFNVAKTMLSIAMLTDSERDTMEFILNNNIEIKESDHDGFEGEVLRGFVDVLQDHVDNAPFKIFSQSTLTDMIRKITTREIAQKVNDNMHANKDLGRWDDIETRRVTYTLKSLGITYATGKGAGHHQSTLDPTTPRFFEHLEMLIKRYDPSNIDVFRKLKKVNKKDEQK